MAAALAQFVPLQTVLPYMINLAICLPAVFLVAGTPETRRATPPHGPLLADLKSKRPPTGPSVAQCNK